MKKIMQLYPVLAIIFLFAAVVFAGLYFTKPVKECPEVNEKLCANFIITCPEVNEALCSEFINEPPETTEKALLSLTYVDDWGSNVYDEEELLVDVVISNYGYVEAKNVEVICDFLEVDEDGYVLNEEPTITILDQTTNIASTSIDIFQIAGQGYSALKPEAYYTVSCRVSSCSNCEILDERLNLLFK